MISRRTMLGGSMGGLLSMSLSRRVATAAVRAIAKANKRCIVLWMSGGPSQFETFDPKPGTVTGGPLGSIKTQSSAIQISETLPKIASHFDKLSVLRNVTSREGEHVRGQYYLHTGYRFVPAFPRPSLGAVASEHFPEAPHPNHVILGGRGFGPAYLGATHAPFSVENLDEALRLMRAIRQRKNRLNLLQSLGSTFDDQHSDEPLKRRQAMVQKIRSMLDTRFVDAFDVGKESNAARTRYGGTPFARQCLAARRLLESGVRFVEVQQNGWDTHQNNVASVRRLCQTIDQPWAALMEDLNTSGLLEETVVVWMGEFGRTPNINANNGRDHFPRVTPVVMGGGGLRGGLAIGKTDVQGRQIEGKSRTVADVFATIFKALGIPLDREYETEFGSPTTLTDKGKPIEELIG